MRRKEPTLWFATEKLLDLLACFLPKCTVWDTDQDRIHFPPMLERLGKTGDEQIEQSNFPETNM